MAKFIIEFGPRSTERLEDLASRLEITRAEVVRRALQRYDDYVLQGDEQVSPDEPTRRQQMPQASNSRAGGC